MKPYTRGILPSSLLLIVIAFQCMIHTCDGFASMFVEKTASCWVDLRDTKTEIIMNNKIKAPEDSPHGQDVSIELYDKETKKQIAIKKDNGKNIVYIEDFRKSGGEKVTLSFLLKLKVADHPDLGDLQYVMDAKVLPEIDEEQPSDPSKPRMTAEFAYSRGCKNMRANGRKGDKGLTLDIGIPASIFALSDVNEQAVDVVAGWACGHEAVTLTESIQFRLMTKDQANSSRSNEIEAKPAGNKNEEVITSADIGGREEKIQHLDIAQEKKEISRNIRRRHKEEILKHLHEAKRERMAELKDKFHHHRHLNLKKLNKLYERTGASFSHHRHLKGLFVIVVLGAIILKFCMLKGKKTKGRRDL